MNPVPISPSWTLFLDRDGVINRRLMGAYVEEWGTFEFLSGVLEAIPIFNQLFNRVVVATNQQGIGKGLMTEDDLQLVHEKMLKEIRTTGGHIDKVYHCPQLASETPNCRKPGSAMAKQAQKDFPEIDFQKSIMVGDELTDMQFGKNVGMLCVFISSDEAKKEKARALGATYFFDGLIDFAQFLLKK